MGRLSRALEAAAPPQPVIAALSAVPPEPAPGQLWRARGGTASLLVLLTRITGANVEVTPVTLDGGRGADTVTLPPAASELAGPLTVWVGLTRTVPMRALERHIGDMTVDGMERGVLAAVDAAGVPGEPPSSPVDPQVVHGARLADTIADLAAMPQLVGSGELPMILASAGLGTADLAALLGVTGSTVLALRRGQAALNPEQATNLARRIGRDPEELLTANPTPPVALVAAMSHPARRPKLAALAAQKQWDDDTAFSHATFAAYSLAARASRNTGVDSAWAVLADRYFDAVLDE